MRSFLLIGVLLAAFVLPGAAGEPGLGEEAKQIVGKIQSKLQEGKRTETELADELKAFDALIAKEGTSDTAAQLLYLKATLYLQVFGNPDQAIALLNELKKRCPNSEAAKHADEVIASIQKRQEAAKIRAALAPGAVFPPFEVTDLAGKPLSIASRKAKVVLIDFWATWCGPCVRELPHLQATYEKFHAKGFDIIGISLDRDKAALTDFIAKNKMPWPQYFDGENRSNKLARQYGISSIPSTFLVDGQGKILATNLRGAALEEAVAAALGK